MERASDWTLTRCVLGALLLSPALNVRQAAVLPKAATQVNFMVVRFADLGDRTGHQFIFSVKYFRVAELKRFITT